MVHAGYGAVPMFEPLVESLPYQDPVKLLCKVAHLPHTCFFESITEHPDARYSYLCLQPKAIVRFKYGDQYCPFQLLEQLLSAFNTKMIPNLPPFQGGLAGLISYDIGKVCEKLPNHKSDDLQFPDISLGVYDVVIAWDHRREQMWVISTGYPYHESSKRYAHAAERLTAVLALFELPTPDTILQKVDYKTIQHTNVQEYSERILRAIDYIYAGDIFEVNITQRFLAHKCTPWSPLDTYLQLRHANPAPFASFLNGGDGRTIVSSSPERFIRVVNRMVETKPIKGTIARGKDPRQDVINANRLINSEKDRAENIMIVDLMRNDLSRVCLPGTIKVPKICALESFTKVHHLVSTVMGELAPEYNNIDLLRKTLPGGSITGAPKIRAMEIIHELEPHSRGPYTGNMAMLGFNGFMDTSILIRTFVIHGNTLTFGAGGAVVSDSEPRAEYQESLAKAEGLIRAIT